jgi:hypothetical protein
MRTPLLAARRLFSLRRTPAVEAALIVGFYATYEAARGIVVGARQPAIRRADVHSGFNSPTGMSTSTQASTRRLAHRRRPSEDRCLAILLFSAHLEVETASATRWPT